MSQHSTTAAFASTSTTIKQSIKQKQSQSGVVNLGIQAAENNLCVLTGANWEDSHLDLG